MTNIFLNKYKVNFINIFNSSFDELFINRLIKRCKKIKKTNSKILIFGNGGSSAIASHFAIDMTKNAKIRSQCFSDPSLITCLSNDYGHQNWMKKSIEFYANTNDLVIFISSSGNSENIVRAAKHTKRAKIDFYSFSGFKKNNKLNLLSTNKFWVDSKAYNIIENIHQIALLSVVDAIIGKSEYKDL